MSQSDSNFWNEIKNNSRHVSWEHEKALQQADGKMTVRNVLNRLQELDSEIAWLQETLNASADKPIPPSIAQLLGESLEQKKALKSRLEKAIDDTIVELPE
ncbi:hypothetical protein [uncultured Brevibacillus sp.]|uniref:hypothetical protein n=1 Tax=uncultured Brevibacillus sp. TaxID=169970 RepID=UPI002595513C|nr:hypothetical protein [uncultured Brevibacillus sp.]